MVFGLLVGYLFFSYSVGIYDDPFGPGLTLLLSFPGGRVLPPPPPPRTGGTTQGAWVFIAWGSIFLTSHYFHPCREAYGFNPPPLPTAYDTSGRPAGGVKGGSSLLDGVVWVDDFPVRVSPADPNRLRGVLRGVLPH